MERGGGGWGPDHVDGVGGGSSESRSWVSVVGWVFLGWAWVGSGRAWPGGRAQGRGCGRGRAWKRAVSGRSLGELGG